MRAPSVFTKCLRKIAYSSFESATKNLKHGIKTGHYTDNYHVYPCPLCLRFHIGRKPPHLQRKLSAPVRVYEQRAPLPETLDGKPVAFIKDGFAYITTWSTSRNQGNIDKSYYKLINKGWQFMDVEYKGETIRVLRKPLEASTVVE